MCKRSAIPVKMAILYVMAVASKNNDLANYYYFGIPLLLKHIQFKYKNVATSSL